MEKSGYDLVIDNSKDIYDSCNELIEFLYDKQYLDEIKRQELQIEKEREKLKKILALNCSYLDKVRAEHAINDYIETCESIINTMKGLLNLSRKKRGQNE
ncbi:MAG: hypothetical protein ACRCSG_00560 [Cellulosilyticaceae bacterium]